MATVNWSSFIASPWDALRHHPAPPPPHPRHSQAHTQWGLFICGPPRPSFHSLHVSSALLLQGTCIHSPSAQNWSLLSSWFHWLCLPRLTSSEHSLLLGTFSFPIVTRTESWWCQNFLVATVWRIPWREEPGGLQSRGSQCMGHEWSNLGHTHSLRCVHSEPCYFPVPSSHCTLLKVGFRVWRGFFCFFFCCCWFFFVSFFGCIAFRDLSSQTRN